MKAEREQFILEWPRWSRADLFSALFLLLTVILLHWQTALFGRLSLDEDTLLFFYPLRAISQDAFVGLWNPYEFCGYPRDGNPQSQLLYPPNIALHFLSVPHAYAVLLVGHLVIGVLGIYLLARFFRCTPGPSLIAALACAVGSFWRCKAMNLGNMEGNAWIPLLLLAFLYGLERRSLKWAVLAGVFASLILGVGAPHPVVYGILLCLLFFFCSTRFKPARIRSGLLFCGVSMVIAAGLAAWSWLPGILYLPHSNRTPLPPEEAYSGSLAIRDLPGILLCGLTQKRFTRLDPWEGTLFFGITSLILAGLGIWGRRNRRGVWALVSAALLGLVFALGQHTPVYPLFRRFMPGVSYLNLPNRALLLGAWSIPLLIGFGAQHLLDTSVHGRRCWIAAALGGLACLAVWAQMAWNYPLYGRAILNPCITGAFTSKSVPDLEWAIWAALLGGTGTCIILGIRAHRRWGYRPHLVALAFLIVCQAIYVSPRFFFQFTSPHFFAPTHSIQWVQNDQGRREGRVLGHIKAIRDAGDVRCPWIIPQLCARLPDIFHLREIQGYDPVYPRVYGELIRRWAGQSRASSWVRNVQLQTVPSRLIDFLGVRMIIGNPASRLCTLPQTVIESGHEKSLTLSDPVYANRLFLENTSRDMSEIKTGTVIGAVIIHDTTGTRRECPVRYGEHVAAFLPGDPTGLREAQVFRWWPVPNVRGYQRAVNYWSRWSIDPPFDVAKVTFRNDAPRGEWAVTEMVLTDAHRDIYPRRFEDNGVEIYENPSAFPPAWIASSYQVIPDATERIHAVIAARTDLRRTVILKDPPPVLKNISLDSHNPPSVQTERPSSDEILCRLGSETTGFLVITEGYSPWWRATIHDRPLPILCADHAFMAAPLLKETGTVRLLYRPMPLYIGAVVSGMMAMLCVYLAIVAAWKAAFASEIGPRDSSTRV